MLDLLPPLDLPAHRTTPREQVHVTVHFIGDMDARRLDDTIESVERSASGLHTFVLTPLRLVALPERGHPRLVALETDAPPPLVELHRRLVHRLARPARKAEREGAGRDRFLPHFTLCRFAHGVRAEQIDRPVSIDPIPVGHVSLVSSVLHAAGARHEELRRWNLGR